MDALVAVCVTLAVTGLVSRMLKPETAILVLKYVGKAALTTGLFLAFGVCFLSIMFLTLNLIELALFITVVCLILRDPNVVFKCVMRNANRAK